MSAERFPPAAEAPPDVSTLVVFLQDLRNHSNTVDALSLLAEEQLIQNVVSTMQLAEEDVYLMNIDFENLHHQSDLSPTVQAVSSVSRAYLQTSAHHLAGFISIGDSGGGSSSGVGNILKPNPSTLNKILTTIGACVTRCWPRSTIAETGILTVLQQWCLQTISHANATAIASATNDVSTHDSTLAMTTIPLKLVHVEYLQACVCAGQDDCMLSSSVSFWPIPTRHTSVELVLRYYYLRGTLDSMYGRFRRAKTCFWTVLSIPGNDPKVISNISVAAWIKLVLVQCCSHDYLEPISDTLGKMGVDQNKILYSSVASTTTSSSSTSLTPSGMATPAKKSKTVAGIGTHALSGTGLLTVPREMAAGMKKLFSQAERRQKTDTRDSDVAHVVEEMEEEAAANSNNPDAPDDRTGIPSQLLQSVRLYQDLVQAFIDVDRSAFDSILRECGEAILRDGNMGLIRQVDRILWRRQLYVVGSIFSALSMQQLSAELELSIEQLPNLLTDVSNSKRWPIDVTNNGSGDGDMIVSFPKLPPSTPCDFDDDNTAVTEITKDLETFSKLVQRLDVQLATSAKYVAMLRRENGNPNVTGKSNFLDDEMDDKGPRGVEDV